MKMNVRGNDRFETPDHIFNQLNDIFNFELDAACTSANSKCNSGFFYDEGLDGLKEIWGGIVCFAIHLLAIKQSGLRKLIMPYNMRDVRFVL